MSDLLLSLSNLWITLALILVAYIAGSLIERRHFQDILAREARYRGFPVINFHTVPRGWQVASSTLVDGSVVISLDYFKRFVAGLRGLVGGRIRTYEPLLDRARREALLRMTESAVRQGYDAVINVRLETSRLATGRRNGEGVAGVEMLAFGTAIKRQRQRPVAGR